jgi:hypothetical protein
MLVGESALDRFLALDKHGMINSDEPLSCVAYSYFQLGGSS